MDDDFEYADAVIAQVDSNGKAEELWLLSDEDFLDYIIEERRWTKNFRKIKSIWKD